MIHNRSFDGEVDVGTFVRNDWMNTGSPSLIIHEQPSPSWEENIVDGGGAFSQCFYILALLSAGNKEML